MKDILLAIYLRLDSTSKSLAKTALAQLVLKIIYLQDTSTIDDVRNEINGILSTKISCDRINESIQLLIEENKIKEDKGKFYIESSRRKKIDLTFEEYENRVTRIIENYFQPTESKFSAIKLWFQNITIIFFSEYKSEWVAQRTYSPTKSKTYDEFYLTIEKETKKNKDLNEKDKDWLISQYIKFLYSTDDDVQSIFWDYGICIYASTLITASTGADKISIDAFRDSKFIIDTNILMYLTLEEDKYYEAYKTLEKIFLSLNITPIIFQITIDEFKKTMEVKRDEILKVIDKFEDDVLVASEDPFIKTAKARNCVKYEDYVNFFDNLLDVPEYFVESVPILKEDNPELCSIIEKGMENEELITKLNDIYKNRHVYLKQNNNKKKIKDKKPRPLKHDAGLISGAEFLRSKYKCQILTREISVKQYGIISALRDEVGISIGLDNLISNLAIDNGGIDIDPTDFKPLFANMIQLAFLPEKNSFQLEDLVRILEVEEQIVNLPSADIIDIAKEYSKNKLREIDDEKNNLQLVRRFQSSKIKYSKDIEAMKAEISVTKSEKKKLKIKSEKSISALRSRIFNDEIKKYKKERNIILLLWFVGLPIITIISTFLGIFLLIENPTDSFCSYIIGISANLIVWFFTNLFFKRPKIFKTYNERVSNINDKVDELLMKELNKKE